jgi:hypothetical protein
VTNEIELLITSLIAFFLLAASAFAGVYEGQIDGDFNGWTGNENIYKLRDGHIIQQADSTYEYSYAYSPDVIIYSAAGVYKAQVDGVEDVEIRVLK